MRLALVVFLFIVQDHNLIALSFIRPLIVIGILILGAGFAEGPLGDVIGPIEYQGSIVFDYPEGDNPIVNIVITVDPQLADNLLILTVPSPWTYSYAGGLITLSGGSLSPGDSLIVQVSLNKYFETGEYQVNSVGTTSTGETSTSIGSLLVGELYLLHILELSNDYQLPLVLGLAGLSILDYLLGRTSQTATTKTPKDCRELIKKCKEAREAAEAAEAHVKETGEQAQTAKQEYEQAQKSSKDAKGKLETTKKGSSDSWIEMDGRRLTSSDLTLRREASKELWDQYRNGDIDAETLEKEWEELGEHDALEELRKKNKEAREKAEKDLEEATKKEKEAKEKADKTENEAKSAQEKADKARAEADKICKERDECIKAVASRAPATGAPVKEKEPEPPEVTEESTEETTYETTTHTTYTTETTMETTTYTTEETEDTTGAAIGGTTIYGPRLGETGLTPSTAPKPPVTPTAEDTSEEEEPKVQKCGPDVTGIYLLALNEIINRLRREYRSAPGGAFTDFWGARQAYGIAFLGANGWNMDFWPKNEGDCPSYPNCKNTFTLMGECIVDHALNDLIYGICAGFFGVPTTIQNLGGHFAPLMAYGGLDPGVSQKIYKAGAEIGESGRHKIIEITRSDLSVTLMKIDEIKRKDCTPCVTPAIGVHRDFSKKKWTWP